MRIVLIVLIGLVLLFAAVFVVGGMLLDKSYELERSIVINAQPAEIHTLTGDLARWDEWAPWKKHDPSVNVTLGDKTTGVGASQTWTSDQGDGDLVFTLWDPTSGVEFDMGFGAGDNKIRSRGVISYEPVEGGTRVTWAMSGLWGGDVSPLITSTHFNRRRAAAAAVIRA